MMNNIESISKNISDTSKEYKKLKKKLKSEKENLSKLLLDIHKIFIENKYYDILFIEDKPLSNLFCIREYEFPYVYMYEGDYRRIQFKINGTKLNIIYDYHCGDKYQNTIITFDIDKLSDNSYIESVFENYTSVRNSEISRMAKLKQDRIEEEEKEQLKALKSKYE